VKKRARTTCANHGRAAATVNWFVTASGETIGANSMRFAPEYVTYVLNENRLIEMGYATWQTVAIRRHVIKGGM
jgi:hypothetical protein